MMDAAGKARSTPCGTGGASCADLDPSEEHRDTLYAKGGASSSNSSATTSTTTITAAAAISSNNSCNSKSSNKSKNRIVPSVCTSCACSSGPHVSSGPGPPTGTSTSAGPMGEGSSFSSSSSSSTSSSSSSSTLTSSSMPMSASAAAAVAAAAAASTSSSPSSVPATTAAAAAGAAPVSHADIGGFGVCSSAKLSSLTRRDSRPDATSSSSDTGTGSSRLKSSGPVGQQGGPAAAGGGGERGGGGQLPLSASTTPATTPAGGSSSAGTGASRIRRLLRGRAHSSHGTTSSSSGNNNNSNNNNNSSNSNNNSNVNCSGTYDAGGHGEDNASYGRGRSGIGSLWSGRPSASKSTSSLLDASSPSAVCCVGAANVDGTSQLLLRDQSAVLLASTAREPNLVLQQQLQQQQPEPACSEPQSVSVASTTTPPNKTKNKMGSWALKLCKRGSPGSSNATASTTTASTNCGSVSASSATAQGTLGAPGSSTGCSTAAGGFATASSKSTNSSPSKGTAPLGYSGCHQGGLSTSLPLAVPDVSHSAQHLHVPQSSNQSNQHQQHVHHHHHHHHHYDTNPQAYTHCFHHQAHQHSDLPTTSFVNSETLCACCTLATSRETSPGVFVNVVNNAGHGTIPVVSSSGTPNATRRRMATAIINQLSSSPLDVSEVQAPSSLGILGSLGGSDDLDERARLERAREIAEGVDPPPGFIRAHEVIPDEIAVALRSLNLDALPWDVLGRIWDLNPSPQQITLSVAGGAASHSPHGSGTSCNGSNSTCSGSAGAATTVHTTVDYMHCLVPDLAQISQCGFYWGKMDRYEAERLLQKKPEGSFLLRDSAQEEYLFSVSFRRYGRSLHARIEQWNHNFSFDSHDPGVFSSPTVCGLIEHYKDPACCMYFEPMLTIPINRNFPFSLQHLTRCAITARVSYDQVSRLHLPKLIKAYLREYHYKQRLRVRNVEKE